MKRAENFEARLNNKKSNGWLNETIARAKETLYEVFYRQMLIDSADPNLGQTSAEKANRDAAKKNMEEHVLTLRHQFDLPWTFIRDINHDDANKARVEVWQEWVDLWHSHLEPYDYHGKACPPGEKASFVEAELLKLRQPDQTEIIPPVEERDKKSNSSHSTWTKWASDDRGDYAGWEKGSWRGQDDWVCKDSSKKGKWDSNWEGSNTYLAEKFMAEKLKQEMRISTVHFRDKGGNIDNIPELNYILRFHRDLSERVYYCYKCQRRFPFQENRTTPSYGNYVHKTWNSLQNLVQMFSEGKTRAQWICVPCKTVELGGNFRQALRDLKCKPDSEQAQRRHEDNKARMGKYGFEIPRGGQKRKLP